jgi:hypothetical protein
MPSYKRQMELNSDPDLIAIEELINEKIDQLDYFNWIKEKRQLGLKKKNKPISRNKRRLAIRKKQLGLR